MPFDDAAPFVRGTARRLIPWFHLVIAVPACSQIPRRVQLVGR